MAIRGHGATYHLHLADGHLLRADGQSDRSDSLEGLGFRV